jgi:hypothetical protein
MDLQADLSYITTRTATNRRGLVRELESCIGHLENKTKVGGGDGGTALVNRADNWMHVRGLQAILHMKEACPLTMSSRELWEYDDLVTEFDMMNDDDRDLQTRLIDYIAISAVDYGVRVLRDAKDYLFSLIW